MSGRIPDSFIEDLLDRIDIVEVIERRLELKRAGAEFQARCPFHEEKTPSFTVSPRKQFYHCFGCGAHGSAIGFLMQFEGLEFPDAVEDLARHAGLQVPRSESPDRPRPKQSVYDVLEKAGEFYKARLPESEAAVAYLKSRGLDGEICRDFGIGFAPAGWDRLRSALGTNEQGVSNLRQAGLLSEGKGKSYDKFRNRIMFPIHDRRGRVIGFGGRALENDDGPKYLNSPETEVFHKGRELYGLYLARQRVGRLDSILVVEGYTDVVALAQSGIRNVVATLGTATTPEQAELCFRAAETIVYCFDGDKAGRKAAWRALKATLPKLREGRQAKFLFLPDGEDPDSLVRTQGANAFRVMLDEAVALSDFLFDQLTGQVDMTSIDGRAKLVTLARPLLQSLPEGVFQDMMMRRLEELARHNVARPPLPRGGKPPPVQKSAGQGRTPVRLAIAHLVQNPALVDLMSENDEIRDCEVTGIEVLTELVDFCKKRPNITTAQLLELLHEHPAQTHLRKLAVWQLPDDPEIQALEFRDAFTGIRLQHIKTQLGRMPNILEQDEAQRREFLKLQQQQLALKQTLRE